MKRSTILRGLLVGFALTVALLAVNFAGDALLALPLVPFDVFGWLTRVLPGALITAGIDNMVGTLTALGFDVADTAKTAEHIMAVLIVFGAGTVLGTVLYVAASRLRTNIRPYVGNIVGLAFGVLAIVIHQSVSFSGVMLSSAVWLLLIFAAWGGLVGEAARRLEDPMAEAPAAEPAARVEAGEHPAFSVEQQSRREFLIKMGGAAAAVTVVGAGVSLWRGREDHQAVPAAGLPSQPVDDNPAGTGIETVELAPWVNPEAVEGTRPQLTRAEDHYLIDINPRPPELDEASWTLDWSGLVDNPISMTLADIRNNYEPVHRYVTLSCISNRVGGSLIGTTLWTGARLQDVLADVGVQDSATFLEMRSVDGFHESLSLDLVAQDPRIMLAYAWNNQPLTHAHGFPLRVWIPDRYGMKQPRWITEIEATPAEQTGYWVQRGWDHAALMKATSVVDTVNEPVDNMVPVGGIAHAGARSISKVEISVDDGEWQEAELIDPLSDVTWVQWRYMWPFEAGRHTFAVRCVDGEGEPQIRAATDPHPSGATGIDSITTQVG